MNYCNELENYYHQAAIKKECETGRHSMNDYYKYYTEAIHESLNPKKKHPDRNTNRAWNRRAGR